METSVKTSLNQSAEIIDLAAYKRKKLYQRKKIWVIMIGILLIIVSSVFYFGEEIALNLFEQNDAYQDINIGIPLQ